MFSLYAKSSSSPSSKLQHQTPLPPENIQNTPFSSQTANKSSSPPLSELKDQKSFSSENTQNTQLPSEINIQLETPFISHSKSLTTPCSLKSLITCENEMQKEINSLKENIKSLENMINTTKLFFEDQI